MPELPEVQTTINDLKPAVTGKRVKSINILSSGVIAEPSPEEFTKGITGRKVLSIDRRGKHLIFKLDNGKFLIVHMRMTGSLLIKSADDDPGKAIRVIIYLDDGTAIHFRDIRRFGRMWLVDNKNLVVGKLGPEPLESKFTADVLEQILAGHNKPIKSLLLDQNIIAGIGNMYADEILYAAGIHPLQPAGSLNKNTIKRLHAAIQSTLQRGIHNNGASTDTFIRPDGTKGEAHLQFQVAHQKGKPCPACGGSVNRIVVNQRGTFYCPLCQKLRD